MTKAEEVFVKWMKEKKLIYNGESLLIKRNSRWKIAGTNKEGYRRLHTRINNVLVHAFAHRVIWIYYFGEIPNGLFINHKNGIKNDNSLNNLEILTRADNNRHAVKNGLTKPFGGNNLNKLDWEDVDKINEQLELGIPVKKISKNFGISDRMVRLIKSKICWAK